MRVTLLGTGTAVPSATSFPAGALVEAGEETILVDAGPGVLRRLAATGVAPDRLTVVLLTHYHPDHSADLVALLFALRNPAFAGRPALRILGAPGLRRLLTALRDAWPRWLEAREYELLEQEVRPGTIELRGVAVTAVPVVHTPQSLAYRIREAGTETVVTISGDADEPEGVIQAARGADLLVCDAAFPEAHRQERHLTAADAGEIARQAGVHTLCLTHLYPHEWAGHDPVAEATRSFAGRVVLGRDLLRFEFPGPDGDFEVHEPGSFERRKDSGREDRSGPGVQVLRPPPIRRAEGSQ